MDESTFDKAFALKYYNGDIEEYKLETAIKDPIAHAAHMKYGIRPTTHWRHIVQHIKCYPQHEELVLTNIRSIMGYLPKQHAYMPYLAFLQSLNECYETGAITLEQFTREFAFYIKQIRNDDIKRGGWLLKADSSELYETHLVIYKQPARNRLSKFLGYDPSLEYSRDAEVFLRQMFADDYFYVDMPYCNADYKAATIVKYKEAFYGEGEDAADASELFTYYQTLQRA